jgi:outer membrane receptor protein involved in Fe transport
MNKRVLAAALAGALPAALPVVPVLAATPRVERRAFDIPAQAMARALEAFGRQSGNAILFDPAKLARMRSRPLRATLSADGALRRLLAGSGLIVRKPNAHSYVIDVAPPQPRRAPVSLSPGKSDPAPSPADNVDIAPRAEAGIIVNGSRINGFAAPTPVTTLNETELETKAVTTVSELLDDVPQLRINQNIGKSSEPVGASNADLRGLGTQRTLVLIDGRRIAFTDPAGTIDTNIVPVALVSDVEIVTGGASAAYGSDAVAGVVNFVLGKALTGLKLDASYGQTIYDDHRRPAVSAAYGADLIDGRLRLRLAADYMHNDGQTAQATRPWGSHQTALLTNPAYAPNNGQPRLLIADDSRFTQMTAGGVLTRATGLTIAQILGFPAGTGVQFGANGNPVPFRYGTNIGGTFMTGGDGASLEDQGNILPEIARASGYGGLRFEVTDTITAFADILYSRVHVVSDLSPNRDDTGFTIRDDNVFLPASVRAAMAAAGLSTILVGRMNYEDQISIFDNITRVLRATFGLEGRIGDRWRWDASGQLGRNTYRSISYFNRINNRWFAGLDAVVNPATGQPICRATLAMPNPSDAQDPYRDIRDCIPINPFGAGSVSARALAYYRGTSWTRARQTQDVFAANLSGSPFSTRAGDVKVAFGVEYRRESSEQTADADSALRRWRSINAQPFTGAFTVKEAYGEFVIPLIRDSAGADSLDLNGAVRVTDYSLSGGVATWKVGARYAPIDGVRFRATLSRDVRAPNNFELFSRGNQLFTAIVDPRDNLSRQTLQVTRGNPALKPEKADTIAFGAVVQPAGLAGFSASLDYYRIALRDAVSTIAPQDIVNFCQQGQSGYCASVVRDPATQTITQVNAIPFNADSLRTSGFDAELRYRRPVWRGILSVRGLANHVVELATTSNGVTNDYVGLAGTSPPPQGVPAWRANLDVDYAIDRLRLGADYRYIAGGKYDTRFNVTTFDLADNKVPGRSYVDLFASYKLTAAVELYGRVENLFNVAPPITPNAIATPTVANSQFFDRRGTFFVLGARLRL